MPKNWFSKRLLPLFYRTVQRCVQSLPPGLIRFRPFGVYEIGLRQKKTEAHAAAVDSSLHIKWITAPEEASCLKELATNENITACNRTTRRAVAVWQDEKLVAVAWVAAESFAEPELGLHYRLSDNEVWLFAAVVDPEYRRQGIYRQLLQFLIKELSQTQVQRILLGVSSGNVPSQQAHHRQGATKLGTIFAAKCLGLVFCKVEGHVKKASHRRFAWRRNIEIKVESDNQPR